MSSCVIKRNSKGKITRVLTPSGEVSTLFDKIAGIAAVSDLNKAAEAYMTIYNDKFRSKFGDWTKSVPRNKEAARSISARLNASEWGQLMSAKVLSAISDMDAPALARSLGNSDNVVAYLTSGEVGEVSDMAVVDTSTVQEVDLDSINEDNIGDTILKEASWDDIRAIRENIDIKETAHMLWKAVESAFTGQRPNIRVKGGSIDGEIIFSGNVLPLNNIENYTPPSSRLVYDSGEPRLFFRSDDGKIHESYANAIKGSSGGRVEAGFLAGSVEESDIPSGTTDISFGSSSITLNNSESFIPILGISSDPNISTRGGFVNYLIKKGMLSGERIRLGDRYYLTGAGNSDGLKIYNAMDAFSSLRNRFGSQSSEMNVLGSIGFDTEVSNDLDLITTSGEKVTVSRSEIKGMLRQGKFEELNNKYDGFMELALSLMMEDNALYGSNVRGVIENEKAEDLQNRTDIANILSTLGIRVMGMSEYMDKYKMRNGVDPSARALSDMANGVIALAEGATVEDLNEEVAHFLVDTYRNQQEIDEVLDSVVGTSLWNQFAGRYYEVYGKEYQGEELDRMVKREILGKTLAQRFVPGMEQAVEDLTSSEDAQLSLFGRMVRAIRNFFSSQRSDLNKVLDRIKESALADDPSAFDVLLLKDSDHLMYSLSDVDVANKLIKNGRSLERLYTRLQRMRSSQSQRIGESISLLRDIGEKVRQVGGELNKNNNLLSTKSVIATAKAEVEYLVTVASSLRKSDKGLDYETIQVIDNVYGEIVPLIRNLRGFVNNQAADYYGNNKVGMVEDMDDILRMAETSMSDINALRSDRNEDWLDGQLRMFNIPERYWNGIKKLINNIHKDINVMSRFFGTLEHSGNAILGMLGQRLAKAYNDAHVEGVANINKMTKMMKERGWGIKDNEDLIQKINGKNSDYLDSSRDFAKYDLLYRTEQAKAIIDIYDLKNVMGKTEKQLIDLLLSDRGLKVKTRDDIVGYDGDKPITKEIYHVFKPTIQNFDISDMTFEDQQRYLDAINRWLDENREKPMVQAYYDKIDKVNKKVEERLGRRV